jgi:RNA polymerase sigma-70 factor, ECF subfamily
MRLKAGRAPFHCCWFRKTPAPLLIIFFRLTMEDAFERVLAEAKAGAEWAITSLYRDIQPSLLRYLRSQAPADGEDLASEVWLDAASGLARFQGDEAAFRRWLFTIAQRRLIDFRRRDGRRRAVLEPLEGSFVASVAADPEARLLASSEMEVALARIVSLSPEQAEVVLLRVIAGLKVEDVATILGKKPGTIRVLQHRALKRLAEDLAGERARRVTR